MFYEAIIAYSLLCCTWILCICRKKDGNPTFIKHTMDSETTSYVRLPDANIV